jgi:MtN3 and saliva related transmembrane protein
VTVASYVTFIGYAAGALTVLALVPQVVRSYRTRRVDDLSWGMTVLLVVSGILWLAYGVLASQRPVILTNVGVVILASALVVAKLRFR